MTYSELFFRRKDPDRIFPDQARKLVAAACNGTGVDPAIFNRDCNGRTLSDTYGDSRQGEGYGIPPRIMFDGGCGFIRMYGVGRAGAELLQEQAPALFTALYKQGFMGFDTKSGDMTIEYKADAPLYSIRTLVVAKKPGACKPFIKADLLDVEDAVGEVILRGMTGVARMLDLDLQAIDQAPRFEREIPHSITLLEGTPYPIPVTDGITAAGFKNVLFSLPYKITGPWSTGLLRSRGYGLIRAIDPTRENRE